MANTLWGKVYYKDRYAGRLQQEPGGRVTFTYDVSYLQAKQPAIAYTLPLREEPYLSERGLHPFFDNLVAEGWFRNAQAKALGIHPNNRFSLLLGFGYDLAGAVSVIDPEPQAHYPLDHTDEATLAALLGRASISGVQRKLLIVQTEKLFRPVRPNELSTHIAKLASGNLSHLLELEYLTSLAVSRLLPDDEVVKMEMATVASLHEPALVIPRFDRSATGKRTHHFEEFNQLLGRFSGNDKYEGDYKEMGQFILNTPECIPAEAEKLLRRILACLLVGNTDAHFKNFAMFHTRDGLRLTPLYDLVASSIYSEYQSIALNICGIRNMAISKLDAKHLLCMGEGFGVSPEAVIAIIEMLSKQLSNALIAVKESPIGTLQLRKQLIEKMEKRWNGSFSLTGQRLLKKQSKGEKNNG
ncbi:MAG: putative Serine kinase HipA [Gammaproteobacteria bacterium]|jgi:serine/threonine-protein kinase HipA|nr:putative Serine kinase HipA [Gammaproteobacteria bacterium]